MTYRLWVNDDRTIFVRVWTDEAGQIVRVETATRDIREDFAPDVWGPPIALTEEAVI